MITKFITVLAAAGFVAGLLALMLPRKVWIGLMPARSRWSNQASVAGALLFGGLALGGGVLVAISLSDLLTGWRSQRWVPVEAKVVESRLTEVRQIRSTNMAYRPAVVYRYEVAGRGHEAQQVAFGAMATPDRAAVESDLATRFAVGASLQVWVNPADPTEAVIEPGVQFMAGVRVTLGLVLLAIGLWQLVALWRDWEGDRLTAPARKRQPRRKSS